MAPGLPHALGLLSVSAEDRSTLVTAWVQDQIDRWRNQKPPKSYQWIGDKLGCSKPHVINLHNMKAGVGPELEAKIAQAVFGGSHDALADAAREWWRASGATTYQRRLRATVDRRVEDSGSEPSELIHAIARRDYLPETIAQARIRARPGISLAQWEDYLDGLDRENRRFDRSAQSSTKLQVVESVDDAVKKAKRVSEAPKRAKR